ncbi:MAG: S9 family peptidase [Candidatus Eremiobacteraeota bacterium]|nr:S9 family peptidase [Candidatus Eremiobacteraeota bacterium]
MKERFFAALFVAALTSSGIASARTIALDDLPKMIGVGDVAISPDAKDIAYIVSRANVKDDRYDRTLELYDLAAKSSRELTYDRKGLSSPAWSPDGTRLAFLALPAQKDPKQQIFVMDMRGGDPMPVTKAAQGVQQFKWRPDGAAIAFVTADEVANKARIEKHLDAFVVGDQAYNTTSAPQPNHIWLVDRDGKHERRLTSGSWSLPSAQPPSSPGAPISWSPDGRSIAFTKMPNAYDADGDLAVVAILDVATGGIKPLTSHGKYEGFGEYSPDGKHIAYWYPHGGDPSAENDVFVAPATGGDGVDVTGGDDVNSNVQRAIWLPGSNALIVSGHKDTDAALWTRPVSSAAHRIDLHGIQPVQGYWLDASVANTGAIAFAGSEADSPTELYYMASDSAAPQKLTNYNSDIAKLDLGAVKPISWTNEGFDENGTITLPPAYDPAKSYPLVLVIHGGPNSSSSVSFSSLNQLLAAHGYIVFNPNYRGSDNMGAKYWYAINNDAGAGPGRDVMAGIAALERSYRVDASRIAVSGWSYGGYMTSWMEGHYNIWKTAVAGAAVNNWIDEYDLSDNSVGVRYNFGQRSPWAGGAMREYVEQSPLTYAWNITTPTLILSDVGDSRVPITQSYEMYRALTNRGTKTQFFAYPVGGHFPSDPVRSQDVDRRWVQWIVDYLK